MRLLLVSDLHYSLKQLDWVTASAAEFDLIVIAGDLLDIRSYVEPDAQIAVALEYLARMAAKTQVIACSGNHDLNAENDVGERAAVWLERAHDAGVIVDGMHVATEDVFISVCPWWDGPLTRERFDAALASEARLVRDRLWIWVYHAPPDNSPTSWTGKRYYGDQELTKWIERHTPGVVLCGHVHESPFVEAGSWVDRIGSTWVVNSGRERRTMPPPRPPHIIFDTETRLATWWSSEGTAELSLEAQYSG
jgi:Icc-related predicted phosphoesterase